MKHLSFLLSPLFHICFTFLASRAKFLIKKRLGTLHVQIKPFEILSGNSGKNLPKKRKRNQSNPPNCSINQCIYISLGFFFYFRRQIKSFDENWRIFTSCETRESKTTRVLWNFENPSSVKMSRVMKISFKENSIICSSAFLGARVRIFRFNGYLRKRFSDSDWN